MSAEPPTPPQVSPDGKFYWDGQRWVTTLSADGRWRWDGTNWVAVDEMVPTGNPDTQLMQQQVNPTGFVYGRGTNTFAAVALIFGIGAYLVCPVVGAIVAVICGHVARKQINRSGESGKGMATAGLILGYIQLVVIVGGFLVEVALLVVPPRV